VNKINPKKLLRSKWTAIEPVKNEKHFIVSEVIYDDEGVVIDCFIEAVISKRATQINWNDLKDHNNWLYGWK